MTVSGCCLTVITGFFSFIALLPFFFHFHFLLFPCYRSSLHYYLNGEHMGVGFSGMLRCRTFFPAFGGGGLTTEFTDIAFDLPIPQDFANGFK
jgi:hypothetical protein